MALLVTDGLGIVRDGAVPAHVVAGSQVHDVVSLGHPEAATQDDVVLLSVANHGARRSGWKLVGAPSTIPVAA